MNKIKKKKYNKWGGYRFMSFRNEKLEEFEIYIKFRKVAIIGLGVSNLPLLDWMYEKNAKVTVFDEREENVISKDIIEKLENYHFKTYFGKNCLENLKDFAIIFRSPSCLPTKQELEEERKRGAIVTTEIEMLMKMCPCKIIGVTGSDGKTTTTSLIHAILQKARLSYFFRWKYWNTIIYATFRNDTRRHGCARVK